jgi:hypothetical protein
MTKRCNCYCFSKRHRIIPTPLLCISILIILLSFTNNNVKVDATNQGKVQNQDQEGIVLLYDNGEPSPSSPHRDLNEEEKVLLKYWKKHLKLSLLATKQKKAITFYRRLSLGLFVTGTALKTISTKLRAIYNPKIAQLASHVSNACLFLVPYLKDNCFSTKQISEWVQNRAASEQMKAECFIYRAGINPYDTDDAPKVLSYRGIEIMDSIHNDPLLISIKLTGDEPRLPPNLDQDRYIEYRVKPNLEFYQFEATNSLAMYKIYNSLRSAFLYAASLAGLFSTATMGGDRSKDTDRTVLVGGLEPEKIVLLLTATSTAIGSHSESWNYYELSLEATRAANDIEKLIDFPPQFEQLVARCEEIIASKTSRWLNNRIGNKQN